MDPSPDRAALVSADELAALDALGPTGGELVIGGRPLKVTNLDKVLFPAALGEHERTKRDLIRYYATIAPVLLPYLEDRALNLQRFPDGVARKGFWQKAVPSHAPEWLRRWDYPDAGPGDTVTYAVVDSAASLAWLAQQGGIELNPWTSPITAHREPSWAYIDIDPGSGTSFADILVLARLYRTALDHLSVDARPKVTGKRGVQIWVPVGPGHDYAQTSNWVETVSRAVGRTVPDLVSWEWKVEDRKGRARLDFTQNAINKTLVAPYSVRPLPGAPVSVPLEWDELDEPGLTPDRWTISTVLDRVASKGDPFAAILGLDQRLPSL
jgi:bifunctional non-homologous end joining protein LigD